MSAAKSGPPAKASLQAFGVDMIKQYGGQEQVELKVVANIPGSWFGGTTVGSLSASQRREYYEAQVVEYKAVYEFKAVGGGKKSKEQAVRFVCISDAMEDADNTGYWMKLTVWNRYRHHTYKDRRDDEQPFIKLRLGDAAEPEPAPRAEVAKPIAAIREHFEIVQTGFHERQNGSGEQVACTWYKCKQPGCKAKSSIKEEKKNTGLLFRHLKKCNPALWRELRLGSKHSKAKWGDNGEEIELMSFDESLPSHIAFVEHCFEDFEVFHKCRSKSLKRWVSKLNERAGLPHRQTCIQLIGVIRTLIEAKLQRVISAHVALWGAPCFGKQSDIWSEKSMREAFFAARLSMQLEPQLLYTAGSTGLAKHAGTVIDAAPMIQFESFNESSHSGKVIAQIKVKGLAKFRLEPAHLALCTEDGASNNKAAAKILGRPFKVCFPHNMQRAVLFSTGLTGKPSQNPELAAEIKKMSAMAAAPHRSVQTTQSLVEAQKERGVQKAQALSTETMNVTRWQGLYKMSNKNRRLEKELKVALTGSEAGVDGLEEEPAEIVSDDSSEDSSKSGDEDDKKEEDTDEKQIQANIAADKQYPLAHRCLDSNGFKNGALLESVLTHPNQVSGLTQKHEGMGLSLGYKMAEILHDGATAQRVSVVSGTSKLGAWKEVHASTLPPMFKSQREIFSRQVDQRFNVTTTPDKPTLLALAMDPVVNTTEGDGGIFSGRAAAQELMTGDKHKAIEGTAQATPVVKREKGPPSVLALMSAKAKASEVANATPGDEVLERVKVEEVKFASLSASIRVDGSAFIDKNIFDHGKFWAYHKHMLPIHYALWISEVGCCKVASANIETVFSGAGRISKKSRKLSPSLLSDYAFCHYNYKYDWLRPTEEQIIAAYRKLYPKGTQPSPDSDDSDSDSEASDGDDSSGDEAEGEEMEVEGGSV